MPRQSTSAVSRLAASHDSTIISTYTGAPDAQINYLKSADGHDSVGVVNDGPVLHIKDHTHTERRQASAGASVT